MLKRGGVGKRFADTAKTGQLGVNVVERITLEMGYAWNPLHVEFGVDGQIEIVEGSDSIATNRIVQVQVKAVRDRFQSESDTAFSYSCEKAHIDYWLGGTAPVILVVCRPSTDEVYWVDIKEYFSRAETRDSVTVRLSKADNVFSARSARDLANIAKPSGGIHLGPVPKKETLISNLFPIEKFPKKLYIAESVVQSRGELLEILKDLGVPEFREWILKEGRIYTFHDIGESPLDVLCDRGTLEEHRTEDLATTEDPIDSRYFVELLGLCITQYCWERGLDFHKSSGMYYFRKYKEEDTRCVRVKSLKKASIRTVVQKYSQKGDESKIYCYRHQGFEGRLQRFGDSWFLEVTPDYHYTEDGKKKFRYANDLRARIKRIERHQAVLGHLLMWRFWLSEDDFRYKYRLIQLGAPIALSISVGIDDRLWKPEASSKNDEQEEVDSLDELEEQEELELW